MLFFHILKYCLVLLLQLILDYNATIFSLLPNYYFFSFFMSNRRNLKKKRIFAN